MLKFRIDFARQRGSIFVWKKSPGHGVIRGRAGFLLFSSWPPPGPENDPSVAATVDAGRCNNVLRAGSGSHFCVRDDSRIRSIRGLGIRPALQIAEAMAPSILFADELEKGLSGVNGSGASGVSTRLFGSLLTWVAEHESDVFFVATANDIRRLPPEFTRAERLDGMFFVDLPSPEQRRAIWKLYHGLYDIGASQPIPNEDGWTGAEIKSCCRLSALLDIPLAEAARNVVPVSITPAEAIDQLRDWASGRCLSADQPGVYRKPAAGTSRRKITPSAN